jgi:hypothetical protein
MFFAFGLNSRKWLKKSLKTERETKKLSDKYYDTWKNISKTFKKDLENFQEKHLQDIKNLQGSLVYAEMVSFEKRINLIQNLVFWGYYHSAMQELRFMLETTILAYYLDHQLPNTDLNAKIKLMQKHKGELWGDRLRRRAYMKEKEFGEEVEKVLDEINALIDQYMAENSVAIWSEESLPFREREFVDCVNQTKNASAFIIKHYNKTFNDFKYSGDLFIKHADNESIEAVQLED